MDFARADVVLTRAANKRSTAESSLECLEHAIVFGTAGARAGFWNVWSEWAGPSGSPDGPPEAQLKAAHLDRFPRIRG